MSFGIQTFSSEGDLCRTSGNLQAFTKGILRFSIRTVSVSAALRDPHDKMLISNQGDQFPYCMAFPSIWSSALLPSVCRLAKR
jgi:hypothetical protein